tara:strand:+ start:4556 stop:5794 length:1239 start_codon:yes stop_codon:yes gene_type:complete
LVFRLAVLFTALALALAGAGPETGSAQVTVTIQGTVTNGTGGAEPPPDLTVFLLASDQAGQLATADQTTIGDGGSFRFDQVPLLEGGSYLLSVDYAGVFYTVALAPEELADEARLTVYETTRDPAVLSVSLQALLIAGVDEKNREISAVEFVRLNNRSDRAFLPGTAETGPEGLLRFSLPPLAEDLSVQSDLPGGDIVPAGTGFALTSAVVPGEHAVDFSFRFPYRGDRVSYRHIFFQDSNMYQVLVPERMMSIRVAPLEPAPTVDIEGSVYRVWEGRDFRSGQDMVLELTNLPEPSLAARFWKSVTDGGFWRVAIPGAAGAVLAFLLLLGMTGASRKAPASVTATPERLHRESPQRRALIREVAVLDERFQQGEMPEAEYRRRRDGLRARILQIPQTAGGEGETQLGERES